jgi:hypothetical protein
MKISDAMALVRTAIEQTEADIEADRKTRRSTGSDDLEGRAEIAGEINGLGIGLGRLVTIERALAAAVEEEKT